MTTITTFEDLLAILEQNPQLRSALRNHILDEELKQLPAIVRRNQELLEQFIQQQAEITANLQAGIDRLNETLNRFIEQTNPILVAHAEWLSRLEGDASELKTDVAVLKTDVAELKTDVAVLKTDVAELKTDVAVLKTDVAELKTDVAELKTDVAVLKTDVAELKTDVAELKTDVAVLKIDVAQLKIDVVELKTDVGWLKGHITPTIARRMLGRIADVTQCRRPRWLEEHAIIDIADDADTGDVPDNELESFRAIDLVMRGIDKTSATGELQYVVIECSATVAANDVTRARRNADYLARFTGVASQAVVIGTEIPPTIANLAQGESVHCIAITNKGSRPR